jgi:hypothetical protein
MCELYFHPKLSQFRLLLFAQCLRSEQLQFLSRLLYQPQQFYCLHRRHLYLQFQQPLLRNLHHQRLPHLCHLIL